MLYPAERIVRVKCGKRLPFTSPAALALDYLVPVELPNHRHKLVERLAVKISGLRTLQRCGLLEKRLRLILPSRQFLYGSASRQFLYGSGKFFGGDVLRNVFDLREEPEWRARRVACYSGEAFRFDENVGYDGVRLLYCISRLLHLVVNREDILRADLTTELGTFKHPAHLLAADAPVAAGLKDENALPCSRSQNVYLGLGGKKRRSKRQRNSKDKSRGKFHDAIIPP